MTSLYVCMQLVSDDLDSAIGLFLLLPFQTSINDGSEAALLFQRHPFPDKVVNGWEQEPLEQTLNHAARANQLPTTLEV